MTSIRRTHKDFANLINYLSKEFKKIINPPPAETDSMIGHQLAENLRGLLRREEFNRKIHLLHYFLELSFINFSNVQETAVKQILVSKKSGQKKMKTLVQEIMTCFECPKQTLARALADRHQRGHRLHHQKRPQTHLLPRI